MNREEITNVFENHKLTYGRMISYSKRSFGGHKCIWNANVIIPSMGKVWYGDLNLTKEGNILKKVSEEIGEPIYVLHESQCRFTTENDPIDLLIRKSVWSTLED